MRLKNPIMEIQPLQVMINRGEIPKITRWYTYSDSHATSELVQSSMIDGTFLNVSYQYVINKTPPSPDFEIEQLGNLNKTKVGLLIQANADRGETYTNRSQVSNLNSLHLK